METGMRLRLNGQGEEGPGGAPAGDLYVQVSVREDARYERHGADLVSDLPVSMVGACLGEKTTFTALDGVIEIDLPAGTQPDTVVRVAGRGLPRVQSRGRGDLHLRVRVQIPTRTTDEERDLLMALRDLQRGGPATPAEG
jgi:molecular chaperone DnaJ